MTDELIWDVWLSQYWMPSLRAALRVGLFDALSGDPACAKQLAESLSLDRRVSDAVLHLLASLGLLYREGETYSLPPQSEAFLVSDKTAFWGPALSLGPPSRLEETIVQALREGTESGTGIPDANGIPQPGESGLPVVLWARGEVEKERAEGIGRVMHAHSVAAAEGLAKIAPGGKRWVLDVGGGSGCFAIELCRVQPELRSTVLELEGMCPVAERYIEEAGLSSRIDTTARNMFTQDWPLGSDVVLLSNVLHDWREETCRLLLKKAFESLPAGGEIWIHEMLQDGSRCAAGFSLMMVLGTQGRQYRSAELKEMLNTVGFRDVSVQSAASHHSFLRARKP